MLNVIQDTPELTRRGFIINYPAFGHWRREAGEEGLQSKPLNVYLHFPYCIQRCEYCHYKTTTLRKTQREEIKRYVDSLCLEIAAASDQFHLGNRPTISVYFGGGTPSLLNGDDIERIMATLRRHLTFAAPEITFEAEPVTLTRRKAEILAANGVNRISVGIQSFVDDILARTGRKDNEKEARESIDLALATGAVVNIDLISGLVGETAETWAYSVRRAIETGVHSITTYKLEVYANTSYGTQQRRDGDAIPSDAAELTFARHTLDAFRETCYMPVNFFTFTRDGGHVQRHTTTKWQGTDNYAFGASAFGSLGNWAYQNTNDLERYASCIDKGELPVFRGYRYSSLDLIVRDVVLGMKLIRLDRRAFKARHGVDVVRLCGSAVDQLAEDGFLGVEDEALVLSEKGILYGDHVGRTLAASLEALRQ